MIKDILSQNEELQANSRQLAILGKTGVLDQPLPIFDDHNIFLMINKVRWSEFFCEEW
jgi:hypothetical protein